MNTSQDRYAEYLQTDHWKRVSDAVKRRASYRCQACNSPHDLNAHHRTYEHKGRELDHLEDLICLCRRCHAMFHGITEAAIAPIPVRPKTHPVAMPDRMPRIQPIFVHREGNHPTPMPSLCVPCLIGGMVKLTRKNMKALMTDNGGWRHAQIALLGCPVPPKHKWARDQIGREITPELYVAIWKAGHD